MDKNTIELENISFDLEGQPVRNNVVKRNVVQQQEEVEKPDNKQEEFRKMQEAKRLADEKRRRTIAYRKRMRQQQIDDWFAGDYSCCLCLPIELGITVIGIFTLLNSLFLLWQINGVTDDGSSKGERAGPTFYNVSYICWSPFLFSIYQYFKYWRKDSEHSRNELIKGNIAVFASIIALYSWMFVYFVSIEETSFQTKNTILLIILLFASPQILTYAYFDGVLKRYAVQIEDE